MVHIVAPMSALESVASPYAFILHRLELMLLIHAFMHSHMQSCLFCFSDSNIAVNLISSLFAALQEDLSTTYSMSLRKCLVVNSAKAHDFCLEILDL